MDQVFSHHAFHMHFCDTNVTVTIRLCPESFSVCLGSSCVRLMGRIFFGLLGSCALAWAVKEVPDSEAGPPAAELPRQTDIDPLPKVKRERPGHAYGVSVPSAVPWSSIPIRRVGSAIDRSNTRSQAKRLRRGELTLSWIGRPWV